MSESVEKQETEQCLSERVISINGNEKKTNEKNLLISLNFLLWIRRLSDKIEELKSINEGKNPHV